VFKATDYPINAFLDMMAQEARAKGLDLEIEPFGYSAEFTPLPAAGTLNQVNATDEDSSFACLKMMQSARDAGNAIIPYPDVLVTITQDASGRAMMDRPVQINNIFGRGQRPFELDHDGSERRRGEPGHAAADLLGREAVQQAVAVEREQCSASPATR